MFFSNILPFYLPPPPTTPTLQRLLAVVLLFLLGVNFCQPNEFSWGGPEGSTDSVDPNTENGERTFQLTKLGVFGYFFFSLTHRPPAVTLCVSSVSHRPGVVRLLSDAAADPPHEEVLQRQLRPAGGRAGQDQGHPQQRER